MGIHEREQRLLDKQTTVLSHIMKTVTESGDKLLSERDREKLQGEQTKINYLKETDFGLGIIKEVDFTIIDGTTFTWNNRLSAAIAYGHIDGEPNFILTGGIFNPTSLRKGDCDPRDPYSFPELIAEIPGHFHKFEDSLAFRVMPTSPFTWQLTVGGTYPESINQIQLGALSTRSNTLYAQQIASLLTNAAKLHIPSL